MVLSTGEGLDSFVDVDKLQKHMDEVEILDQDIQSNAHAEGALNIRNIAELSSIHLNGTSLSIPVHAAV